MKKWKRILALTLITALLCASVPIALGETLPVINESESIATSPLIIGEDASRRERNVKHFQLSDGSYMAVVYDVPVHYPQGDEWVEIDNSLVSATLVGDALTGTVVRDTELTETQTLPTSGLADHTTLLGK